MFISYLCFVFFFSSRRRHTRCALVTGVQTCALPMLALALTSTRGWIHRLGRNWQRLHRSVYAIAALSVWHFWLVRAGKNDFFEPYVYGALLAVLLLIRLFFFARQRRS